MNTQQGHSIQDNTNTQSFNYSVILQCFEREDIINTLNDSRFIVTGEYCNQNKAFWTTQSGEWIVEAIKQ